MKKIVIFGAGKIGRSFIGQLFGKAGYEVVFVDISERLINAINEKRAYTVIVKSDIEETIVVENVKGILADDTGRVISEIATAGLVTLSVGQQGLPHIIPTLAKGIEERLKRFPANPLDIIIAENMRNARTFLSDRLKDYLPQDCPFDEYVGLVETSIGKMVPIMPREVAKQDILQVFAEPYNTLILDRKAFKNRIPDVKGLSPKENISAWVDQKLFIHNLGHACAAYAGFYYYPQLVYMHEVLDHERIRIFTRQVMEQSAQILLKLYPDEFSFIDLQLHIDNLLHRFCNRALGDTVFRVGMDLQRKLGPNDRLLAPFREGVRLNLPVDKVAEVIFYGTHFRATDESGQPYPADLKFIELVEKVGALEVLQKLCALNRRELEVLKWQFREV